MSLLDRIGPHAEKKWQTAAVLPLAYDLWAFAVRLALSEPNVDAILLLDVLVDLFFLVCMCKSYMHVYPLLCLCVDRRPFMVFL